MDSIATQIQKRKAHQFHQSRAHHLMDETASVTSSTQPTPDDSTNTSKSTTPIDSTTAQKVTNFHHRGQTIDLQIEPAEPELRRDYLFHDYVLIAPKRFNRPFDTRARSGQLFETASSPRLDTQEEVFSLKDDKGGWLTKVVNNKFPSLTLDNPKSYGKQEIVIDTPMANIQLGELDEKQIVNVLMTYQERIRDLAKVENIKYVLVFKNEGHHAGASLAHAHTQIFALPMVPQRFLNQSEMIEQYFDQHKADPFDTIIKYEKDQQKRVINENDNFISFCPYAPLWPLEAWILPKQAVRSFDQLSSQQIFDLATVLRQIIHKLTSNSVNFNFFIENGISTHHRLAIKVRGRDVVSPWGGFEIATGMVINSIPPEAAATWYKKS